MEGTVLLTKALIQRPRPYTYNTSLDLAQRLSSANNESFLSGNAGVLFYHATFASLVIRDLYPEKPWLPYLFAATHGLAALSSYWSVRSGMHFPSDVLAGALWGSGVAILVTQLHKTKARQLKLTPWALQLGKGNLKSSHEAYGLRLEAETRLKVFGLSLEYCF